MAESDDVSTVICAPVYSRILGLSTEVPVGMEEGLPRHSAIRCDFLTLMFKERLAHLVTALPPSKLSELDVALAHALGLDTLVGA